MISIYRSLGGERSNPGEGIESPPGNFSPPLRLPVSSLNISLVSIFSPSPRKEKKKILSPSFPLSVSILKKNPRQASPFLPKGINTMTLIRLSMEESDLRITVSASDGDAGQREEAERQTIVPDDGIKYCQTRGHLIILHGGMVFIYEHSFRNKMATRSGELGEIVLHYIKMFVARGDDIGSHAKGDTIGIAVSTRENESITIFNYRLATNDISSTNKYVILKGTDEPLPCPLKFNYDGTILFYFTKNGFQMMGSRTFSSGSIGEDDIPQLKSVITSRIPSAVGSISRAMIYKSVRGDKNEFVILTGEDGRIASYSINTRNLQASPISVSRVDSERLDNIFSSEHTVRKGGIEFIEDLIENDDLPPPSDIDPNIGFDTDTSPPARITRQTFTGISKCATIWLAIIIAIIVLCVLGMGRVVMTLAKILIIYLLVCCIIVLIVKS